jgi:hypothetical protein
MEVLDDDWNVDSLEFHQIDQIRQFFKRQVMEVRQWYRRPNHYPGMAADADVCVYTARYDGRVARCWVGVVLHLAGMPDNEIEALEGGVLVVARKHCEYLMKGLPNHAAYRVAVVLELIRLQKIHDTAANRSRDTGLTFYPLLEEYLTKAGY